MTEQIRVVLADDHPLVRAGIRTVLGATAGILLVGEAADGPTTLATCRELQPDVVLLDLNMPDSSPFATVNTLRADCPEMEIVILTAYDDDAYVRGLTAAGISGYVLKDEALEVVVSAIHSVVRGGTWFSRGVVAKLTNAAATPSRGARTTLTNRERQLLELLLNGQDGRQIATALSLSEQTVRNYLSRLYDKLEVNSRAEAIVWARDNNFAVA